MKVRALYDLARFLPLMSWSGNASLLGIASALIIASGFRTINWPLTLLAIFVSVALQYVAHPINDLVDYPVDVQANIDGTGRRKVLISGLATERDLHRLSRGLLLIIAAVATFIIWFRPLALFFGAIGFLSVWVYNMPPFKLSYRPFPELLIAFPVNIAMVVGISYVATGTIAVIALVFGVIQAFMAAVVHISYFAMDMQSDFLGGKISTIVKHPGIQWCTIYPLLGAGVLGLFAVLALGPLTLVLPVLLLGAMTILGFRMDALWMGYWGNHEGYLHEYVGKRAHQTPQMIPALSSITLDAWHSASCSMRDILVRQMYLSVCNGMGILVLVLAGMSG
ncbi:MAG: prenyltransferase [Methanomicrobiales archaeon]|nr:prenyltransferase [Methanomicrobiales archaeon]